MVLLLGVIFMAIQATSTNVVPKKVLEQKNKAVSKGTNEEVDRFFTNPRERH